MNATVPGPAIAPVADGGPVGPTSLTVLYDEQCVLCRRCRAWLETQRTWVPVHFVAASASDAVARRGDLPWLGDDLVVVGDAGEVWAGSAAFLMCLWATVDYRGWSSRLSGPAFAPLAERFFHMVSSNRSRIGAWIAPDSCAEGRCRRVDHGPARTTRAAAAQLAHQPPPPQLPDPPRWASIESRPRPPR